MNTSVMMKRHPKTAIAFALVAVIAAGCSSERDDERRFGDTSVPAAPRYAAPAAAATVPARSSEYATAGGFDQRGPAGGFDSNANRDPRYAQPMQPRPTAMAQEPSSFQQQPMHQRQPQQQQQPSQQQQQLMEWERREKALVEGIELPEDVIMSLRALGEEVGLDLSRILR